MTMPRTFTKSAEKKITEDWQRVVPSLGIYKPRWLLRRVGPLLEGICLDRDSSGDAYKPIFHVHCLGRISSSVSLTLGTQLCSEKSGGPDFVQVRWHEEKYRDAARRMVRQSLLPLSGDLKLSEVINVYERYLLTPMGKLQSIHLYFDMITLLAWSEDRAGAQQLLDELTGGVQRPPGAAGDPKSEASGHQHAIFRHVGGQEVFMRTCQRLIENPLSIRQTVEAQIVSLGLESLPQSRLLHH